MQLSDKASEIVKKLRTTKKLGDVRSLAKQIKQDNDLAIELWSTEIFYCRMLAVLIFDKKELNEEFIHQLFSDMLLHAQLEQAQLADWLMANQLLKNKSGIALIESWKNSNNVLQRRLFWYYQGRLRWMGKIPYDNAEELLDIVEKNIVYEDPLVQWAMNFTTGQIGIHEEKYRTRCINIGLENKLYKDEKVSKGCTPNYLPLYITMEVEKKEKNN